MLVYHPSCWIEVDRKEAEKEERQKRLAAERRREEERQERLAADRSREQERQERLAAERRTRGVQERQLRRAADRQRREEERQEQQREQERQERLAAERRTRGVQERQLRRAADRQRREEERQEQQRLERLRVRDQQEPPSAGSNPERRNEHVSPFAPRLCRKRKPRFSLTVCHTTKCHQQLSREFRDRRNLSNRQGYSCSKRIGIRLCRF